MSCREGLNCNLVAKYYIFMMKNVPFIEIFCTEKWFFILLSAISTETLCVSDRVSDEGSDEGSNRVSNRVSDRLVTERAVEL